MATAAQMTAKAIRTPQRRSLPTRPLLQQPDRLAFPPAYCGTDSTETVYNSCELYKKRQANNKKIKNKEDD